MASISATGNDAFARAQVLGTSTLYKASKLPCAVDPLIRSVWPGAFIAAPAYPLACSPGDNLAIHVAVERAPRGGVLVISTDNFIAGYWGEVLTVAAEARGIVGLIIDGGVRDVKRSPVGVFRRSREAFPSKARSRPVRRRSASRCASRACPSRLAISSWRMTTA